MKHPHFITTPEISKRMAHVHLKGGKTETMLAKALWHKGLRYRLNYKKLPGSPDIAILKYKIAIFVDGEFWHGYDWENRKLRLKTNQKYWNEKIEENINRDKRNNKLLRQLNWLPVHFWEKQVHANLDVCLKIICEKCNNAR
ncbi:very short patch repair endonuclease [Megasphaera paucivorans]|uniref:T/G mismatch-specific endonuclease n=1 Tax=Megasphaera paucivorans TaxID=349095 RepID=A0A1G9WYK0_9FIRM|nr:very short patch repair endonuclease [Megasphaera paucivorans]SDM89519.1 T/G mismatch-specific endonuclease [Megasphaera paucivorans]